MIGLCVYCGLPTPRGPTCVAHTDLPKLDPAFGLASVLAMVQYPALVLENRAPAPRDARGRFESAASLAQRIGAYDL